MKAHKILALILLLLSLGACKGSPPAQAEEQLADKMTTQEYTCVVDDTFTCYALFVTNTSDKTVSLEMNVTAKDQNGGMVAAHSDSTLAVAPGQTSCMWTTFDEWDVITDYECSLVVSEENSYRSIHEDVTVEYDIFENKVIAKAINNGEEDAHFVWAEVVFLKDGEMVGFREISLMYDTTLPAGSEIAGEGELYSDTGFDSVVVAINGRI